jgi:hypothetical protein
MKKETINKLITSLEECINILKSENYGTASKDSTLKEAKEEKAVEYCTKSSSSVCINCYLCDR